MVVIREVIPTRCRLGAASSSRILKTFGEVLRTFKMIAPATFVSLQE